MNQRRRLAGVRLFSVAEFLHLPYSARRVLLWAHPATGTGRRGHRLNREELHKASSWSLPVAQSPQMCLEAFLLSRESPGHIIVPASQSQQV